MRILQGPKKSIDQLVFAPDNSGLAAGTQRQALYWPTFDTPRPRAFGGRSTWDIKVEFLGDGSRLLMFSRDKHGLRSYAIDDEDKGRRAPTTADFSDFACAPTEPLVVARTWAGRWYGWEIVSNGVWKKLWDQKDDRNYGPVFSADGTRVFQQARRGRFIPERLTYERFAIAVRDPKTGELREEVPCSGEIFCRAVISPDAQLIANRPPQTTQTVEVFARRAEWEKRKTLRNDNRKHFTGIAFHPSGRYLAATSNDATVKLYDTTTWEVARTFTWDIGRMRSIAFSPEGTLAAAGSDTGKVVVWDVDL